MPAPAQALAEGQNRDVTSGKRGAPADGLDNLPPSKKARAVSVTERPTPNNTSSHTSNQVSTTPIPRYTTSPPSLSNSLTTVESRPSSPTLNHASTNTRAHGTYSISPQPSNASTSGTAGGGGAGVLGRSFSSANRRQPVKKGWKGWLLVEEDELPPESPTLIKIDEPIVLQKTRQTRSGRAFAGNANDLMVGVARSPAPDEWRDDLNVDPNDENDDNDRSDTPLSEF